MNMLMKNDNSPSALDEIQLDSVIGVKGRYRFVVRNKNLKVVRETAWMDNLILNAGLNKLLGSASASNWFAHCVVGTGNAPVLPTNTVLSNYNGVYSGVVTAGTDRNYTVSPYYLRHTIQYRFVPTGVARNIAEAGIVFSGTASKPNGTTPIDSRVLIVDGGGTPTTIAVGADEYLDVVWQYTVYPGDQFSGTFNLTIDGVSTSFNYIARPADMVSPNNNNNWWKGATGNFGGDSGYASIPSMFPSVFESGPRYTTWASTADIGTVQEIPAGQGSANQATSVSAAAYVAGSFQRSYEFTWGLDKANMAIKSLVLYFYGGTYQMSLTPTVAKVATKVFKITVRLAMANVP